MAWKRLKWLDEMDEFWLDNLTLFCQNCTWNCFTLIDVHALSRVDVLKESGFAGQISGTFFARMTPSFTDGGTAQLFGADHTLQLAGAHVILDSSGSLTSSWRQTGKESFRYDDKQTERKKERKKERERERKKERKKESLHYFSPASAQKSLIEWAR